MLHVLVLQLIMHTSHSCEPLWQVMHLLSYVDACHGMA